MDFLAHVFYLDSHTKVYQTEILNEYEKLFSPELILWNVQEKTLTPCLSFPSSIQELRTNMYSTLDRVCQNNVSANEH